MDVKARKVAEPEHGRPPWESLGDREQDKRAIVEERRASRVRRVHTDVGEEHGHGSMLTVGSEGVG
jgi:hypothetical protein